MTSSPAVVALKSPADIIGAIPHLVGFHPTESVVVICLNGPRHRSGLTMRADLPTEGPDEDVADYLSEKVIQAKADAALIVIFSDASTPEPPLALPRHRLVIAMECTLSPDVEVLEAILVRKGRWYSYSCNGAECCPPEGTPLPETSSSAVNRIAAETVGHGAAVLPDRHTLAQSIRPPGGVFGSGALRQAYAETERAFAQEVKASARAARDATVVALRCLRDRYTDESPDMTDAEAARVVVGLRDKLARDSAATLALDSDDAAPLLAVLVALAQRALAQHAAPVCTVLAWVAYQNGLGALANVAVDRALECEPDYEMARLLAVGLENMIHPSQVRSVTRDARREIRRRARREAKRLPPTA